MSKKNNKKRKKVEQEKVKNSSDYYKIHSEAVDRLVNASAETAPEVSEEELRKYHAAGRFHIHPVVKVLFIKFWFYGAICFFFFWGLGTYLEYLDLLFVLGFAMGVITDLLTNNALRFFEKEPGEFDKFIIFPQKKFWSLFLNVIYGYVLLFCVYNLYGLINLIYLTLTKAQDAGNIINVEPLMFGLFCMGFDMLFVGIKNLFKKIVKDAKESVTRK